MLQAHLAGTRVVKAFNTLYARWLAEEGRPAGAIGRTAIPIAGDDPDAKSVVSGLIDEIGFDAVDLGGLAAGRRFQPGRPSMPCSSPAPDRGLGRLSRLRTVPRSLGAASARA